MNLYKIVIQWMDERWGPQMEKLVAEGTSARRALNKSLLAFFRDKSRRKERRNAHRGFTVTISRLPKRKT